METKRTRLALCCLVTCLLAGSALALPTLPDGWVLVFDEPFSGRSILNTAFGYQWTGYEGVCATEEGVSVGGGYLTLTSYTTNDGGTLKHWGGTVATQNYSGGNLQWTYGYFEARIKLNNSPGNMMAYWLDSDAMFAPTPQPASAGNEVDITEHGMIADKDTDISNVHHMAIHWGGYKSGHREAQATSTIPGLNGTFHTFGLLWTPTDYRFYVDDVLQKTWTPDASQPFMSNRPAFIVLDTAPVGGWNSANLPGGYGTTTTSTTKMIVDYVRVYNYPPPTITISTPSSAAVKSGSVTYTVDYTGATAVTLSTAEITLNKTGTANGSVAVSGTGTATRTVTISDIKGKGTLGISIAVASASNSGATAQAAGPSATFVVGRTGASM